MCVVPEVSVRVEDLHARALASTVADDKVSVVAEDGHLARVPEATLGLALVPEHVLEDSVLVEHLKISIIFNVGRMVSYIYCSIFNILSG